MKDAEKLVRQIINVFVTNFAEGLQIFPERSLNTNYSWIGFNWGGGLHNLHTSESRRRQICTACWLLNLSSDCLVTLCL